ncbi:unnamed protein product [Linum trigynum]|uniref:Uncharacterized protein n=1 Tax=Linum trigynum TaxID=586398 RepID=A0AAV2ELP2_9ROSI
MLQSAGKKFKFVHCTKSLDPEFDGSMSSPFALVDPHSLNVSWGVAGELVSRVPWESTTCMQGFNRLCFPPFLQLLNA